MTVKEELRIVLENLITEMVESVFEEIKEALDAEIGCMLRTSDYEVGFVEGTHNAKLVIETFEKEWKK